MVSAGVKRFLIPAGIIAILLAALGGIRHLTLTFEGGQVIYRIPAGAQMLALGVGLYWDVTCTGPVTMVDWGTLTPGQTKGVTVYIKNTGNGPMRGSISSDNWVPDGAGQYFDLTWDFGSLPLEAGRVRKTTIYIHVHDDITGITDFSFNIIITGTQVE